MINKQDYQAVFSKVTASGETYRRIMTMTIERKRKHVGRRTAVLVAAVIALMTMAVTAFASEYVQNWFATYFADKSDSELSQKQLDYIEENAQSILDSQTNNGWTVELRSAFTDGTTAYIIVGVTAPEEVSLEQTIVDGVYQEWFNPGNGGLFPEEDGQDELGCSIGEASVSGNYWYQIGRTTVEDGDGLANTKNWVYTITFHKFDSKSETAVTEPFGSDIEWNIHMEDIVREYVDEGYRQELLNGKYAGQTDIMFTNEETKRLHVREVLAEGTWDFTVNFGESGEGVELLSGPLTMEASVMRRTGREITEYEFLTDDVTLTSFVLRELSAVIQYECDGSVNFTDYGTRCVYAVMKDGMQIKLEGSGGGGTGFAVLTAVSPIVLEDVDYILMADGTIIKMPA